MWDPQWTRLAERFDVVRCDLRGSGESPLPDEPYDDAEDVRRLMDALEIGSASVVGASFGGLVALEFAGRWQERVKSLVLLSPAWNGVAPDGELRGFAREEESLLESGSVDGAVELNVKTWLGPEASAETRDRVRQMQRRAFDVQLAAPEGAVSTDPETDPAGIEARTLILSGAHDLVHFRNVAMALVERIPNAEHRELGWAGHLPSMERPDFMTELLVDYLGN
jgi:3-oxoadipate enol-lactonase